MAMVTASSCSRARRRRTLSPSRIAAVGLVIVILGSSAAPATQVDQPVVKWLHSHAVRLATVEPETGFEDLKPLRKIVGRARVVLLGEATHGSREFFQLKHRILEFLASEMGFNVFAQEGMWARTLEVNKYVTSGQGTAAGALAGPGWVRNTEEHLSLVEWMRRYNQQAPAGKKLRFYGFDMQDGVPSLTALLDYLKEVDPDYARRAESLLSPLKRLDSYETVKAYPSWPADSLRAIREGIAEARERLRQNEKSYSARTGRERWAIAMQHARVIAQAEETWRNPQWPRTDALRDRFMAENILSILAMEGPKARIVVSAHNGHVTKGVWGDSRRLGSYLKEALDPDVLSFGFAFNRGSFQARHHETNQVIEHTVGAAPEGSISWVLAKVGLPLYIVDLRDAPKAGPVAEWLRTAHPERSVGAVFNPSWEPLPIAPGQHYDVLAFVEQTRRARPVK